MESISSFHAESSMFNRKNRSTGLPVKAGPAGRETLLARAPACW